LAIGGAFGLDFYRKWGLLEAIMEERRDRGKYGIRKEKSLFWGGF
jgi:hypothetical protein